MQNIKKKGFASGPFLDLKFWVVVILMTKAFKLSNLKANTRSGYFKIFPWFYILSDLAITMRNVA